MFSITKRLRFPAKIPSLPANRSTSTSTFPVPIDSCSFPPSDHQTLCLFLADRLIKRRLLSATRSVVERIIQRSSLPDAVSVLDFAAFRGLFSDPKSYSSLLCTLVRSGQLHKVERIYTACRGFTDPTCGILRGTTCESVIQAIYQPLQLSCGPLDWCFDGGINSNLPNPYKIYQRRRCRVVDQAALWIDDAYPDFDHQEFVNPPLNYHQEGIRRLHLVLDEGKTPCVQSS